MNAHENFAGGSVLSIDYNFSRSLSAGLTLTASSNFTNIMVLEPAALIRWNFFKSFFVQADAGVFYLMDEYGEKTMFLGGLRAGFRKSFGTLFYLEPYGRFGYPFMFGAGVMAGVRFPVKKPLEVDEEVKV